MDNNYFIFDARTEKANQGPFSKSDATKMAKDLNDFVHRNSDLGNLFPNAIVTGPFYPVTEEAARRMSR